METTHETSGWAPHDLERIGTANEVELAPAGRDGSRRRPTTIWVVRVGDGLYVRSYRGSAGSWYRQALRSRRGRVRASGLEREVTFADARG